ncbi:MAG: hypothetical protein CYG60_00490 [Actinobacteria bacterium]|nr:MAG: hypothetical protein CYG60_00490 [Actinomycetota bacterium]
MNAHSKDLRVRVLAALDRDEPRAEVVRVFGVSLPTVKRWLRRRREGEPRAVRVSELVGQTRPLLGALRRPIELPAGEGDVAARENRRCQHLRIAQGSDRADGRVQHLGRVVVLSLREHHRRDDSTRPHPVSSVGAPASACSIHCRPSAK